MNYNSLTFDNLLDPLIDSLLNLNSAFSFYIPITSILSPSSSSPSSSPPPPSSSRPSSTPSTPSSPPPSSPPPPYSPPAAILSIESSGVANLCLIGEEKKAKIEYPPFQGKEEWDWVREEYDPSRKESEIKVYDLSELSIFDSISVGPKNSSRKKINN